MIRNTSERRDAIQRIIRTREIGTQEELVSLLAEEGFEINQATVSRDLALLGAVRVSRPDGGSFYGLEASTLPAQEAALRGYGNMIFSIQDTDSLVVLNTQPGSASAVARAVDLARLSEAVGTIAGDDTIFVAPAKGVTPRSLGKRLKILFGKDN